MRRDIELMGGPPLGKTLRVGANFWCKSLGMHGGMVIAKIDSCITL